MNAEPEMTVESVGSSTPDDRMHMSDDLTLTDLLAARMETTPDDPFLDVDGVTYSFADVDVAAGRLAGDLRSEGMRAGDRLALYLQNDPQFVVGQLAAWKIGAVAVPVNPMLRHDELAYVLVDSGARALLALSDLYEDVAKDVVDSTDVRHVVVTDLDDMHAANPPRHAVEPTVAVLPARRPIRLAAVLNASPIAQSQTGATGGGGVASIGYTSGTSGAPKGVPNTHANIIHSARVYQQLASIDHTDVFFAAAPLFHITGLTAGVALSLLTGMTMVLVHRFDAGACLAAIERAECTFTVMASTAYRALLDDPAMLRHDLSTLAKAYSGGAPVPDTLSRRWEAATGHPIYNVYGMTETTGPTHAVPWRADAPVDEASGALSVGRPVPGASVRVVDPASQDDVACGQLGELWVKGPMVVREYWRNPTVTEETFVDGWIRTGDVGFVDDAGWYFVVDRIKDLINASGFKVAPREVESVLGSHPDVREAAVVGAPDEYRGETVHAFVTVRSGSSVREADLIEYCRARLAAYKYPRRVFFVQELPKTASGKVLRRVLRDIATGVARPSPDT